MSVEGGNWQIFAKMLEASGADVYLNSKVDEIEIGDPGGKIQLSSLGLGESDFGLDALVLASPYHQSGVRFTPLPSYVPENIPYVRLHVTLFSSPRRLSPRYFGLKHGEQVPDVVLTTTPGEELKDKPSTTSPQFHSISMLRTVVNPNTFPPRQEHIYKIFSTDEILDSFLHELVDRGRPAGADEIVLNKSSTADENPISWIYRKTWLSYPYMTPRITFEPQNLDQNLWYTSGIETFISTMETSALAGKNVARLIVDGWLREQMRKSSP